MHQSAIFVRGDCVRGRRRCFLGFTFVAEVLSRLASEPPFQAPTPLIYIFLFGEGCFEREVRAWILGLLSTIEYFAASV